MRIGIILKIQMKGRPGIKKNSREIFRKNNRTFNLPSKRYEAWEKEFAFLVKEELRRIGFSTPINVPVNLKLVLYLKNHSNEPDLSNSYQGIEDCLEECGVITDDKLIYSHDGSDKVFGSLEDWFEVELTIKEKKCLSSV